MKKLKIIPILLVLFCFGCSDYLDKKASNDITEEDAYENMLSAKEVLNNVYWEVKQPAYNIVSRAFGYGQASDDAVPGHTLWGRDFHAGSWTADDDKNANEGSEGTPPTCAFWTYSYQKIRKANLFIQQIETTPGDDRLRVEYKAEARFLRAFFYSELIKRFGGVVLSKKVTSDYNELTKAERSTFEESVDWVVSELDEAALDLPLIRSENELGRATQGACYAVKSRLLLFAASPLFNTDNPVLPGYTNIHYYGNFDANRWKLAADAARQVINLGMYKLNDDNYEDDVESPENYFRRFSRMFFKLSDENVFSSYPEHRFIFFEATGNRSAHGWNWSNPSLELAETFEMTNGLLPGQPTSGYDFENPGNNRDPRFKATIQYPGASYASYNFEPWIGGSASHLESQKSGMCNHKMLDENFYPGLQGASPIYPYMHLFRYAEILLNYAEAINEFEGPTGEVYNAINQVRARVGMPALPGGLTKELMRERIVRERRVELAFEDHRFFDVRRWRIAEDVLNGNLHGYDVNSGRTTGFWKKITLGNPLVFRKQHYLYPISTQELLISSGLVQNPGW